MVLISISCHLTSPHLEGNLLWTYQLPDRLRNLGECSHLQIEGRGWTRFSGLRAQATVVYWQTWKRRERCEGAAICAAKTPSTHPHGCRHLMFVVPFWNLRILYALGVTHKASFLFFLARIYTVHMLVAPKKHSFQSTDAKQTVLHQAHLHVFTLVSTHKMTTPSIHVCLM